MKYRVIDENSHFFNKIGKKDCSRNIDCGKIKLCFNNGSTTCFYLSEIKKQNMNRRIK